MNIRKWKIDDIQDVVQLLNELNEALNEDQQISLESMSLQYYEMGKNPEIYENYVYEDGNKIVGFISLLNYRSIYHKKGTTQINELIVSKENRKKGIGKELLGYAIKRAKENGMDEIEVGVMKENKKAIKFYKRNGIDEEYYILGKEFE
jgi:ribosomal protein S18 acetylase RimI-like enzyme